MNKPLNEVLDLTSIHLAFLLAFLLFSRQKHMEVMSQLSKPMSGLDFGHLTGSMYFWQENKQQRRQSKMEARTH